MTAWKHDDLAVDLHSYLSGNARERMCWLDMQLGPAGSPRPDVYAIEKSYSRFVATAFECKVSRSDFLADVTTGKWQSYFAYSGAIVFAAPDGLLKASDIPVAAGLIVRKDAVWRYAKKPRIQALDNLPRAAWMKLLMDGVERVAGVRRTERVSYVIRERAMRAALGEEIANLVKRGDGLRLDIDAAAQNHDRAMDRIRAENASAQESARERDRAASRTWARLCEFFDLPPHSREWAVERRIAEVVERCDADARVKHLTHVIDGAVSALGAAKLRVNLKSVAVEDAPSEVPFQ